MQSFITLGLCCSIASIATADPVLPPLTAGTAETTAFNILVGLPIEEEAPAAEATEEKSPWSVSLGLGLNASKTDSKTVGFNANASAVRKDDLSDWASDLKYIYNVNDDTIDDNFLIAQTLYNRLLDQDSPWSWFARSSYQFNQTESYRQRFKAFGGGGYFVSRTDDLRWNLNAGLGTVWNEQGTEDGWTVRSTFGTSTDWKPMDGLTFTGSVSIENDLARFQNYLLVTEARLDLALAAMADNLSLYLTVRDEYDNAPAAGDQYNSIWVTLGLAYGF